MRKLINQARRQLSQQFPPLLPFLACCGPSFVVKDPRPPAWQASLGNAQDQSLSEAIWPTMFNLMVCNRYLILFVPRDPSWGRGWFDWRWTNALASDMTGKDDWWFHQRTDDQWMCLCHSKVPTGASCKWKKLHKSLSKISGEGKRVFIPGSVCERLPKNDSFHHSKCRLLGAKGDDVNKELIR